MSTPQKSSTNNTYFQVRRDRPPTAPSASAEIARLEQKTRIRFGGIWQKLAKNKDYILASMTYACLNALLTVLCVKTDQILCTLGYTTQFSGYMVTMLLSLGPFMFLTTDLVFKWTKHQVRSCRGALVVAYIGQALFLCNICVVF